MTKKTKICATLGPACEDLDLIVSLIKAGVNITRLNFSHGDYQSHAVLIKNIRQAEEVTGEPIAIMQDLQGPKIRVGVLPEIGAPIKIGDEVIFDSLSKEYKPGSIPLDYPNLHNFVEPGHRILVDDGHRGKYFFSQGIKFSR